MTLLLAAASEEPPLIDLDGTIWIQLGLFLVLIFLLNRLLYRPYLRLLDERDRAIDGRVREAEQMERRAKERLAELEKRLGEARARGADERARIRAEAAVRERELLEVARHDVARRVATAKEEVAKMGADLRATLAPEVDALARRIASQVLGRDVN